MMLFSSTPKDLFSRSSRENVLYRYRQELWDTKKTKADDRNLAAWKASY